MILNILRTLLFSILFLLFTLPAQSQQRFKAGIIGGLTAAQILGDDIGGYDRLGIQGGLRAIAIFTEKSDLNFEILYSQRGSRDNGLANGCFFGVPMDIVLRYVEVPVVMTFKDWLSDDQSYYRIQVSGGFSYSRLISGTAEGSCHDDLIDFFNENDVSFTLGAEYFANEHLAIGMRFSRSINLLYNRKKGEAINRFENSLRGYFLSFRTAYIF